MLSIKKCHSEYIGDGKKNKTMNVSKGILISLFSSSFFFRLCSSSSLSLFFFSRRVLQKYKHENHISALHRHLLNHITLLRLMNRIGCFFFFEKCSFRIEITIFFCLYLFVSSAQTS